MPEEKLPTSFMPAEKAAPEVLERQRAMIAAAPLITETLDGTLSFSLILNSSRQAVYINKSFREFLAAHGVTNILGQRIGNLAGCTHSEETTGGCGTTEACQRCGAGQALAEALKGEECARECRIMSRSLGDDLDLKVTARPFSYNGEDFLLMSLLDISSDKRREVLERLFFHDVINTAGGVQGLLGLMDASEPGEVKTYVHPASKAADRMIEQILSQKDLSAAERGDLQPKAEEVDAREFLGEVAALFAAHEVARNKKLEVAADCEAARLTTDRTLLSRVIGNLAKNALEAEPAGATVTLSCKKTGSGVVFSVHNPSRMPEDTRLQIFQRSFSTKGGGRGLGTYSIRLLTVRYLKGKVSFTTGDSGTTFFAEYPATL